MKKASGLLIALFVTLSAGTLLAASIPAVGSSQMGIEFTDFMINDELVQISTGQLQAQTQGEAGRTARGAAIGALAAPLTVRL